MLNKLTATPVYDLYFLRRFIEEIVLAETAPNPNERSVHLEASRHLQEILQMGAGPGLGRTATRDEDEAFPAQAKAASRRRNAG